MAEKLSEVQREAIGQKIPLKKMGTPQDVAEAALFLASDRAAYVSGGLLKICMGHVGAPRHFSPSCRRQPSQCCEGTEKA